VMPPLISMPLKVKSWAVLPYVKLISALGLAK